MRSFAIINIINARYLNSERYLITYCDRNLLRDQEPIVFLNRGVRNLFMHKRVELCENGLE